MIVRMPVSAVCKMAGYLVSVFLSCFPDATEQVGEEGGSERGKRVQSPDSLEDKAVDTKAPTVYLLFCSLEFAEEVEVPLCFHHQ